MRGGLKEPGYLPPTSGQARVPIGYKMTEVGVIPDDWDVSSVGAEFAVQLGKMLDAARNVGTPKPYVGNRAIQWGRIEPDSIATVPMTQTDQQRFRLRRGDLLVCEGGEIGRAAIWNEPVPECYYQKALHRLRATRGYDAHLMRYLLELWAFSGYLANHVTQTSIAHLPKERLEVVPLPVPSPPEQRAIARALSDVDELIGALERLIAKKRAIKQATMQQLLTGKTRLPGFGGEWETKRLGEIGSFSKGRGIRRNEVTEEGLPCVRYGELYTDYDDHIVAPISRIPASVAETALPIRTGDLLFAGSGETAEEIGRCAAYLGEQLAFAGGDIVVWSPEGQHAAYLGYLMNHPTVAAQRARFGQGDAVVHISASSLAQVEVELPPLAEQSAIATVLSNMDAEIAALERRRDKTRAIKQAMMQQLLTGRVRLVEPGKSDDV